ncbi:PAN-3 domain-containing protein [Caenorhabditis elegans]|uniref:PAN-3 domain-containing protein n=1 Tax=Caenorhabditis elegans TaxID=6239 RepID=O02127_CAEEL|nr:PAN-3 domain-containing protein [Caenorhabditis elegans]CCD68675.1 PAN-3 domain-containing protein [Caenorhabditis elegans]|eukprot:NP_500692.1 C-type LECtin [Caenorhabditis elegans]
MRAAFEKDNENNVLIFLHFYFDETSALSMFFSFCFFIISIILELNASVNMLLFWGYPASDTKFCEPQLKTSTFNSCIDLCLSETYCMLAFGNDSSCTLCDIYAVNKITQSNSITNIKTAIKVDSQFQCPKNMTINQYNYTNGFNNYKAKYSAPTWTISYDKNCLNTDFRMFPRPVGAFYLAVLPSVGNKIKSTSFCKNLSSSLDIAGMQSKKEFDYVLKTAKFITGYTPDYQYTTVWLSGTMRSACQTSPIPSGCDGLNAFSGFPYQDNFDVYQFAPGYPYIAKTSAPRSLQLLYAQTESELEGKVSDAYSEYVCDGQNPAVICVFSFTCGGLAK